MQMNFGPLPVVRHRLNVFVEQFNIGAAFFGVTYDIARHPGVR
jgi:hypothetical protein